MRKATQFVKVDAGQEAAALRWLAHEEGQLSRRLSNNSRCLKARLEAAPDVAILVRRGNFRRGDRQACGLRFQFAL